MTRWAISTKRMLLSCDSFRIMLLDAAKQVSDGAGKYQVEGAKTFGTLNFGGSTATTVSFVVGSAKES